jgi:hypothetical protein
MYFISLMKAVLPANSYFTVAIAAIDRPALTWFERYRSCLAAIGTYRRVHLPPRFIAEAASAVAVTTIAVAVTAVSVAFCFPCLTAFGAAFGLIGVSPRLELLLFRDAKGKSVIAIGTF